MNRVKLLLLACAISIGAYAPRAFPQVFPTKPIELVVHTGPGGGADIFARQVAEIFRREKLLPQPFVVANRTGGGGAIAMTYAAGKRGDPYVVLTTAVSLMLAVPIRSGLDVGTDKFHPLVLMGYDLNGISVRADSPYKTLKDLLEAARANPKSINVALGSVGGASHYLPFMLEKLAGVRLNLVSMKSGAEAITGVLGGHLQVTSEQLSEMVSYIESGQMRVLAVAATKRLPTLPNVPTLRELGFDLHVGAGRGFYSPAAIPAAAAAVLESAFEQAYKSVHWQDYMQRNYYEPLYMNHAMVMKHLQEQQPRIAQYIQELGLATRK
jgi:putative tricarboxylic transport membrane protein